MLSSSDKTRARTPGSNAADNRLNSVSGSLLSSDYKYSETKHGWWHKLSKLISSDCSVTTYTTLFNILLHYFAGHWTPTVARITVHVQ
jgi:tRNA(His) 5'-end guanylyltransferase